MSDLILVLSQKGSDTLYKQDQFQRDQQAPECLSSFANIPLFAFQISPPLKINSAWNSSMDGNFFMTWHFFHFGVWNSFTMSLYIDLENQQLKWVLKMLSVCTNLFRVCLQPVSESVIYVLRLKKKPILQLFISSGPCWARGFSWIQIYPFN